MEYIIFHCFYYYIKVKYKDKIKVLVDMENLKKYILQIICGI